MNLTFALSPAQERLIASFGSLEIQTLQMLWRLGARNIRQIHTQLNECSRLDFITVMASVSRLIGAGLLTPEPPPSGLSYSYRPTLSRDEFLLHCGALLNEELRDEVRTADEPQALRLCELIIGK